MEWTENGAKFETRTHEATNGRTGTENRVGSQDVPVPGRQGTGHYYVDVQGNWYHTSVLKPNSPTYNAQAAADTHMQF